MSWRCSVREIQPLLSHFPNSKKTFCKPSNTGLELVEYYISEGNNSGMWPQHVSLLRASFRHHWVSHFLLHLRSLTVHCAPSVRPCHQHVPILCPVTAARFPRLPSRHCCPHRAAIMTSSDWDQTEHLDTFPLWEWTHAPTPTQRKPSGHNTLHFAKLTMNLLSPCTRPASRHPSLIGLHGLLLA